MLSRSISIVSIAVASSVLSLPQQKLKCEKNQQKAKIYKSSNGKSVYLTKDENLLAKKLGKMSLDGPKSLKVVTDFDFTLTKFFKKDFGRAYSCHKVLEECNLLNPAYHTKARELHKYYYPKEVDANLDTETRIKFMEEWVTSAHGLFMKYELTSSVLDKAIDMAVKNDSIKLREGVKDILSFLYYKDVPVLIFSAGIANILSGVLQKLGVDSKGYEVASNQLTFDADTGKMTGFKGAVYHVFNKMGSSVPSSSPFMQAKERRNLILLGDSFGDLNMKQGIEYDCVLEIGFLNDKYERLEAYLDLYDIVCLGDPEMDVVADILSSITHAPIPAH